ncbi:hypothetical protein [Demequina activiva]|uniref:Uncharacterized protein n=1 Tax=Demequina activiva TaxID=1582364 RepID=A0A919Q2M1_9MICO|nr:hypothetical protein [Demequina activiva]GIG53736.1 hypothetical protein Dac01nite_04880 [Demequina activiva]
METWQAVLIGLIPSIGVGLLFWFVMRSVMRADRREREALAQIDREEAQARAAAAQASPRDTPDQDERATAPGTPGSS